MFEIGNSLREARERQGLELAQLETETKVRAKYLRALEEERFDVLPGESYARGFLEVYARRLGLDSQLYADEFDSRFARGEGAGEGVRRIRSERRLRFEASAVALGLLGIVAVTVLVIAAWQFSGGDTEGEGDIEPPPAAAAAPPEQAGPQEAPAPAAQPSEQVPAPAQPQPSVDRAAELATLEVTAVVRKSRLTVRRNGRNGRVVFAETLERGESRTFEGARLHAAFRNPKTVSVRVNGEELSAVPRRLLATADGWRQE